MTRIFSILKLHSSSYIKNTWCQVIGNGILPLTVNIAYPSIGDGVLYIKVIEDFKNAVQCLKLRTIYFNMNAKIESQSLKLKCALIFFIKYCYEVTDFAERARPSVRFSFSKNNTKAEIDYVVEVLKKFI